MNFQRAKTNRDKYRLYDSASMRAAFQATQSGMSVYRAARQFEVPESTLRDRTLGLVDTNAKLGTPALLTESEEHSLAEHIKFMASIGYGYSKKDILHVATNYAISIGKKSESDPLFGDCWFYRFMKRCGDLQLTKPRKLAIIRAKATSKETVNKYYDELNSLMTSNGLHDKPENLYNIDETGISLEHNPPKVVCDKGSNVQAVTSPRGQNVTIIGCGNAQGNFLPPYYIFPGKRWNPAFMENTCAGAAGEMSDSGWSNSVAFTNFLQDHFVKHVNPAAKSNPVLILFDGHKSHVSLALEEWGRANNVIFFVLPPHTSHLLQPLDIGCFAPLKTIYYRECQMYLRQNPGSVINKYVVGGLSSKAYVKAMTPSNLIAAFQKSGIYPFNKNVVTDFQLAPSTIYPVPEKETNETDETDNNSSDQNNNACQNENETEIQNTSSNKENQTTVARKNKSIGKKRQTKKQSSNVESGSSYLKSITITNVTVDKKSSHRAPSVVGNLASEHNMKLLSDQRKRKDITQSSKTTCKSKKTLKFENQSSPKPGTSGLSRNASKMAGIPVDETENDTDEDTSSDDATCCICKQFRPPQFSNVGYLVLLSWAQCDTCQHWTHLKFCSSVHVVRRDTFFQCPHCNPETAVKH